MVFRTFVRIQRVIWDHLLASKVESITQICVLFCSKLITFITWRTGRSLKAIFRRCKNVIGFDSIVAPILHQSAHIVCIFVEKEPGLKRLIHITLT